LSFGIHIESYRRQNCLTQALRDKYLRAEESLGMLFQPLKSNSDPALQEIARALGADLAILDGKYQI